MKRTPSHIAGTLLLGAILASCASVVLPKFDEGNANRRVIDVKSGAGLPNAYVGIKWTEYRDTYVHGLQGSCAHVAVIRTDADGRFRLPNWKNAAPTAIVPYNAGYTWVPDSVSMKNGLETMEPFVGTALQRFEQLDRTLFPLGCTEAESKNLVDLYRAVHGEAASIAKTEAESLRAERYQVHVEAAVYGHEEARKRATSRDVARASKGGQK